MSLAPLSYITGRDGILTVVEKGTLHTVRAGSASRESLASALFAHLDTASIAAAARLNWLIAAWWIAWCGWCGRRVA